MQHNAQCTAFASREQQPASLAAGCKAKYTKISRLATNAAKSLPLEPRQGCHAKHSAGPIDKRRHRRPAGQTCGHGGWRSTCPGRCGQNPPSTGRLWKRRLHLRHLAMLRVAQGARSRHAHKHARLQALLPGLLVTEAAGIGGWCTYAWLRQPACMASGASQAHVDPCIPL